MQHVLRCSFTLALLHHSLNSAYQSLWIQKTSRQSRHMLTDESAKLSRAMFEQQGGQQDQHKDVCVRKSWQKWLKVTSHSWKWVLGRWTWLPHLTSGSAITGTRPNQQVPSLRSSASFNRLTFPPASCHWRMKIGPKWIQGHVILNKTCNSLYVLTNLTIYTIRISTFFSDGAIRVLETHDSWLVILQCCVIFLFSTSHAFQNGQRPGSAIRW